MGYEYSDEFFEQLKDVRDSGQTNMLDQQGVQTVASQMDHDTLYRRIRRMNPGDFFMLITEQFTDWLEDNYDE